MQKRNSTIVDQYGNPFKVKDLAEPQTERSALGFLNNTFSGHPSRGLTPAKIGRILQEAEQGNLLQQCELMEDMEEKDGHIYAEMGKRRGALLTVPWNIEPPRGADARAIKHTELINDLFATLPDIDSIILDMADAVGQGFSNLEIEWQLADGYQVPAHITHRPASWFMTPVDNRNQLRLRNETGLGEELRPFGWIAHRHKAKPGYITRAGLVRVLAWPYLFKNYSVRDLAEFLEIYGLPLRLGKYPSGAGDKEKFALMQAVVGIGHSAAGIIPEGMSIDFVEAAKGASDPFEAMMTFCERTVSKTILGQTLSSQADGKSSTNALGKVHEEVRMDIRDSDLKQVANTLRRDLLYPLLALNVPGITGMADCPVFKFDTREPEDMKAYSEALPELVDIGMEIPVDYAHEKLGIPKPEKGQAVLRRVSSAPGGAAALSTAALASRLPTAQQTLDDALTAISPTLQQGQMEAMLAPLIQRINAGDNLEQIQDELSDLYPALDVADIEELLTRLFFVAETWGRLNA